MIDFTSLNSFRGKSVNFQLKKHDFLVSPCVRTRHLVTQGSGLGRRSLDQGFWRYAQANEIRTMSLGWLKKTHILNSGAMSLGELGFFTRGSLFIWTQWCLVWWFVCKITGCWKLGLGSNSFSWTSCFQFLAVFQV